MLPRSVDGWMDSFIADIGPDNEPGDIPSVHEMKAVSDYLHDRIPVEEAAFAYTRDTISGKTNGHVWFLIYHIAQDLPETQDRLIELIRAIATLPNELCVSGREQLWSSVCLQDLGNVDEHWSGNTAKPSYLMPRSTDACTDELYKLGHHPATARHREFVDLTIFIGRLRSEGLLKTSYFDDRGMFFAFEKEDVFAPEKEESVQALDTYLLATARYMELAVQDVFTEGHREPLRRKAREDGYISHWQLWKSRMAVLVDEGYLHQETRSALKSALARMMEVESVASH
ncbi:MAG: hypothetical protein Q9172_006271 [Xanthocarpia lactea]